MCKIKRIYVFFLFLERERDRDRDSEREGTGEGQRGRETQNLKQAPGSELSAQSPMQVQTHEL